MSRFLASVSDLQEAQLVLPYADILDLKNPAQGALGALVLEVMEAIVRYVDGRKPISATIGDLPMEPKTVLAAIQAVAATGVDIVKVGMFPGEQLACIDAVKSITASGTKVVAVLFADSPQAALPLSVFREAGFYGVMLDTAVKDGSSLLDHQDLPALQAFVEEAAELRLVSGLAGALRLPHVEKLCGLQADYLGFRSALCHLSNRTATISESQVSTVQQLLFKCNIALKGALAI
ncbi:MAG TPA: (5-formylfuran-3-yl)methyl phosphate synthase [Methylovorus sp.]|nr:(5-formylfuran-3-yl)methyl phosphate synthase [Methylovorus sp.]